MLILKTCEFFKPDDCILHNYFSFYAMKIYYSVHSLYIKLQYPKNLNILKKYSSLYITYSFNINFDAYVNSFSLCYVAYF